MKKTTTAAGGERIVVELPGPVDLFAAVLRTRLWMSDPSIRREGERLWMAMRTPEGIATAAFAPVAKDRVAVIAFGPAAEWVLAEAPNMLGYSDPLEAYEPEERFLKQLHRKHPGLRLGKHRRVYELILRTIIGQRVTGKEAGRSFAELCAAFGEDAPGPRRLRVAPPPERLARLGYYHFHRFGIERSRAESIIHLAREAPKLERLYEEPPDVADARIGALRHCGQWTVTHLRSMVYGDPDSVLLGDYWMPHTVTWALAREPRGSDARMLELLEAHRPNRGRVTSMLVLGGVTPPRFGPRIKIRNWRRE